MDITNQIVHEGHITTMMITHNIRSALANGSRTIMLDAGKLMLDVSGETRAQMTVDGLMKLYSDTKKEALDNDRMLFA